jgi:NTP pyrophosphatase (non-canonical NTP hydrolase)
MTNTIQEKLGEILQGLPSDALDELHDELHDVLCNVSQRTNDSNIL